MLIRSCLVSLQIAGVAVMACFSRPGSMPATAPASPALAQKQYPQRQSFGVNLARVTDWSTEWPFANAFKTSRPWMVNWRDIEIDKEITCDSNGNPLLTAGQSV